MPTITETLQQARLCHHAGDLRQAERLYQQVVQADGQRPDVWLMLGQASQGLGKLPEAAASYRQSLGLDPASAETHFRLATALADQGQREQAASHFRQALQIQPGHGEALLGLGIALAELGQLGEAVTSLRAAVHSLPESAKAHYNLGVALAQQQKLDEAAASLRQAIKLQPNYPPPHYGLGNVLVGQGKRPEAIPCYREAIRLKPDFAGAYNNLGLALAEERRLAEAVVVLRQTVRLRPQAAEAHNNLGMVLAELGRFAEAEGCYHEALRLSPGYADAHNNLGSTYKEQGRTQETIASYDLALLFQPNGSGARWNRALAWLSAGDFEHGWPEYEWRWNRPKTPPRRLPQPRWDGGSLAGKTLLIYVEQGLGDTFQFIRYAPLVKAQGATGKNGDRTPKITGPVPVFSEQGATVLVECPAFLHPLLSRCKGIDRLLAEGSPLPDFDCHTPLLSLPHLLGTTWATLPAEVPYLFADPERVGRWAEQLRPVEGFKVGIAWQGNPHHQWDHFRSFPADYFAALAAVPGVRLISLQKGQAAEQLRRLVKRFPITELDSEKDAPTAAFMDTAAVMQNLDLVVTADTSLAHLAGGLGVPVWVPLSTVSDWRWLLKREDSPWYPTMRLFLQKTLGDWDGVFRRMATALRKMAKGNSQGRVQPFLPRSGCIPQPGVTAAHPRDQGAPGLLP
jgi:tetratricopeptide (TPR) repeat protein